MKCLAKISRDRLQTAADEKNDVERITSAEIAKTRRRRREDLLDRLKEVFQRRIEIEKIEDQQIRSPDQRTEKCFTSHLNGHLIQSVVDIDEDRREALRRHVGLSIADEHTHAFVFLEEEFFFGQLHDHGIQLDDLDRSTREESTQGARKNRPAQAKAKETLVFLGLRRRRSEERGEDHQLNVFVRGTMQIVQIDFRLRSTEETGEAQATFRSELTDEDRLVPWRGDSTENSFLPTGTQEMNEKQIEQREVTNSSSAPASDQHRSASLIASSAELRARKMSPGKSTYLRATSNLIKREKRV